MLKIIFLLSVGVKAKVNPHGPTVVSDYSSCVIDIVDKNFDQSGLLYFVDTFNVSTPVVGIRHGIIKSLHKKMKYSVKVSAPTKRDKGICIKNDNRAIERNVNSLMDQFQAFETLADYVIAIIEEYKDFTYIASRLIRARSWNPRALFILVYFSISGSNDQNIRHAEDMLFCLFKVNVINAVVIIPEGNNVRKANIYSWRPYEPPKYCGYYNESIRNRLIVENVCEQGKVKYAKKIFEPKIPSDMMGCSLKVLALERQPFVSHNPLDPNIERLLIDQVAQRYNLTLQYEVLNEFRGEKSFHGDWDGAIKELTYKKGDLLLGGIFPDDEVHQDFECSSTYLADSYTWVVPRALPRSAWLSLFIIFQKTVWLTVITCFVLIALSWMVLAKLSKDASYRTNLDHYFINTWLSNLGFCGFSRPMTNSLRIFFVFINLYFILFLTAYQTKLIDVLTNPSFEYQISTVEELVESGLQFGGSEELHDLFENSTDDIDNYFLDGWIDIADIKNALRDVAIHRNFSLMCSRLELAHVSAIIPELSDQYGNYMYYAFPTNVFTVPLETVSMKGFPFMKGFSSTLTDFRQYGVNKAVLGYFAGYLLRQRAELLDKLESEYSKRDALSIQTLQGGYFALILGTLCGTFVFIVEIILNTKIVKNIKFHKKFLYMVFVFYLPKSNY
uniref:Putative ionotropic receptor IR60a n=1 Tax=Cydia nigricana TaxID=753170 RepID=A0A1Q1PP76_9NEOP|nr:putative ionotropic receptor IR60a [Cydia nigricana]